jgi:hypothetical protein
MGCNVANEVGLYNVSYCFIRVKVHFVSGALIFECATGQRASDKFQKFGYTKIID